MAGPRIVIAQMKVGRDLQANEARILALLSQAEPEDLVVFPEGALTGYFPEEDWYPRAIDPGALDRSLREVQLAVSRMRCHCVLGSVTIADGGFRNSAIVLSHSGATGVYHKVKLGHVEARCFQAGAALPVFAVGGLRIGIQICREVIFPGPWSALKEQGAQLVLHVNNAIQPHDAIWDHLLVARALESSMFVCSVNNAAPPQALASYLVDPHGQVLLRTDTQKEQMLAHEIAVNDVTPELESRRDF
jgi:predicted amidohydrolase